MKKTAPTLADEILRFSFGREWGWFDPDRVVQQKLTHANKFVLDDKMSAFLADLAWASTLSCVKSKVKTCKLMDGVRHLSRLPHRQTWIEWNNKAKVQRVTEAYGGSRTMGGWLIDADTTPGRCGWLIEQHPQIETAFRATSIASCSVERTETGWNQSSPDPSPTAHSIIWCSEDHPLPWPHALAFNDDSDTTMAAALTGMKLYRSPYVGIAKSPLVSEAAYVAYCKLIRHDVEERGADLAVELLSGLVGEARYIWSLLATINSLPIANKFVTASKGYVAKGRYRKFVDHTVITLNVPETRYRRIAAQAIAVARRRAHEVRGHWRKDHWHPGERIWIHEHQRGDASIGFVTHDYEVHH